MQTMKALACSWLVVGVFLGTARSAEGQTPVGALAIDQRQGDQYGWAVDDETSAAAQAAASRECGARCSVVVGELEEVKGMTSLVIPFRSQ